MRLSVTPFDLGDVTPFDLGGSKPEPSDRPGELELIDPLPIG